MQVNEWTSELLNSRWTEQTIWFIYIKMLLNETNSSHTIDVNE